MKQLKELLHQNEGITQERKKQCRIWGSKEIITGEAMGWWLREVPGWRLSRRPWEQPVQIGATASRR